MKTTANPEAKNRLNSLRVINPQKNDRIVELVNQKVNTVTNADQFNKRDYKGIVFEAVVGF